MTLWFSLEAWWRGFFFFFCFYLIHVVCWRTDRVKKNIVSLVSILIILPSLTYALFISWEASSLSWLPAWSLHMFLSANYIAAYPAIQANSPTLEMLYLLARTKSGLSKEALVEKVALPEVMEDRIDDLLQSRLLKRKDGRLALAPKGNILATFFILYRRFIGLPTGTG